jgi:hypothetical protein
MWLTDKFQTIYVTYIFPLNRTASHCGEGKDIEDPEKSQNRQADQPFPCFIEGVVLPPTDCGL